MVNFVTLRILLVLPKQIQTGIQPGVRMVADTNTSRRWPCHQLWDAFIFNLLWWIAFFCSSSYRFVVLSDHSHMNILCSSCFRIIWSWTSWLERHSNLFHLAPFSKPFFFTNCVDVFFLISIVICSPTLLASIWHTSKCLISLFFPLLRHNRFVFTVDVNFNRYTFYWESFLSLSLLPFINHLFRRSLVLYRDNFITHFLTLISLLL